MPTVRTASGPSKEGGHTPLGDALRAIRRKKGILLSDMARVAKVSSGFLSMVETGKKPIPERLVPEIVAGLDLGAEMQEELLAAAALSAREFKIHLQAGAPAIDRQVAHKLQTGFAKMSPNQKAQILKLLEEG